MELPDGYDYVFVSDSETKVKQILNAKMADKWLEEYQDLTSTTWRVRKTFPDPPDGVVYKV